MHKSDIVKNRQIGDDALQRSAVVRGGTILAVGQFNLTSGVSPHIAVTDVSQAAGVLLTMTNPTGSGASTTLGIPSPVFDGTGFTVTSHIIGTPGSPQTGDNSAYLYAVIKQD
jgi:hypothetical protein